MKRKITVIHKGEKLEVDDVMVVYVWEHWIEFNPKGKEPVMIQIKRGTEITIKCT